MKYVGEYKLVALKEIAAPSTLTLTDQPELVYNYWRDVISKGSHYNGSVESFYVLFLNTRRRVLGHYLVSTGTLDTILVHPREVFKAAIVANASAIILIHNHPSGDPSPSEQDIKVTRDLIRAGQLLKIDVLDHIVMGVVDPAGNAKGYSSLRELGYFLT